MIKEQTFYPYYHSWTENQNNMSTVYSWVRTTPWSVCHFRLMSVDTEDDSKDSPRDRETGGPPKSNPVKNFGGLCSVSHG